LNLLPLIVLIQNPYGGRPLAYPHDLPFSPIAHKSFTGRERVDGTRFSEFEFEIERKLFSLQWTERWKG
jgi:hypothetical protein